MTSRDRLSAASERTSPPPISTLMQMALDTPGLISLAAGFVDQKSLPVEAVARGVAAILSDPDEGRRALQYGTTIGDLDFRTRLVEQLERDEGADPGAFRHVLPRTVVTTGSQQLLSLVAEALLDPGDIVLVESPTYFVYLGVLETRGAHVIGIRTDGDGLRLDVLEHTLVDLEARGLLGRVKLIYTVSEHANPTGICLAESRRGPLVEVARRWSKRRRIYILEDAAYRGLTFDRADPPSVWRHDPEGDTVILARTFSKTFSPGLKMGYGILPGPLLDAVLRLKGNQDFGSSHFTQQLLERLIADGSYERHVERLVGVYRHKCHVMVEALDAHLGPFEDVVSWTRPKGGLYVWLTVPEGLDTGPDGPLFSRSIRVGVLYVPGAYCFVAEPGPLPRNHARLCFGVPGDVELEDGARRLAAALAECLDLVA
ncbi:MAG: PLP-dependent aminotransferase family protein [Planctomycetaceae bacterium]|nr:PLP-dependent aminotransferase family protein [Planctomycetaceae bacterium]